jgi:cytochrome c-type biogenesis protein CcmE
MQHQRAKLTIGGLILVAVVGYLSFTGVASGWVYYLSVDEFLADSRYQTQRVRICGMVAEEAFDSRPGELAADFLLLGDAAQLAVIYRGVVPPTFVKSIEVIVEGRLNDQGQLAADVLLTKCASKYQAEEHDQRLEDGHAIPRR